MSKISLLSEELINKIAAGEVIERPASVVKELIENSLDSNATHIQIEIKDYGKELIKITDNGEGMDKEDLRLSILPHATSKLKELDDLFSIQTLGFRGEALASIATISNLTIISTQKGKIGGYKLEIEGGAVISLEPTAAEPGTILEVRNLFFNTPARKKFLKTDSIELRHIIDVVTNYSLINPKISFQLLHNNSPLLNVPAVSDSRNNLSAIYGPSLARDLLEVNYQKDNLSLTGFICRPFQARNDKSQQIIFVNNRWIKNSELSKAVYEGYHSLLFVNKHPIFILHLQLEPKLIDINIHPQKSEIKFSQKETVLKIVVEAIRETLRQNNLIPTFNLKTEQQISFVAPEKSPAIKSASSYTFEPSSQTTFQVNESEYINNYSPDNLSSINTPHLSEHLPAREFAATEKLPLMKILGQINKTFFVAETPGGVIFIDQHVVQERVLYEKFMQQYIHKNIAAQNLLQPEILELTIKENIIIKDNLSEISQLGFQIELFGQNSFILKSIPSIFGRTQPKELLQEIIHQIEEHKTSLHQIQEDIITRMSCRASVKAGDTLTINEINSLLKELNQCILPYTCPHGRSIFIKVSADELEKKFKRK